MNTRLDIGKRERNKEAIKLQLLTEARRLFALNGFDKTTVAEIVAACNIGRGTFYNYFSDVKDIFNTVVEEINEEIRQLTKEARNEQNNVYDLFYASMKAYFDFASSEEMLSFHKKNQAFIRSASYKSDSIKRIIKDLQTDIAKIEDKVSFHSERDLQLLTYVLVGTPAELFLNNMSVNSQFDNHEVATFLAKLFTTGSSLANA